MIHQRTKPARQSPLAVRQHHLMITIMIIDCQNIITDSSAYKTCTTIPLGNPATSFDDDIDDNDNDIDCQIMITHVMIHPRTKPAQQSPLADRQQSPLSLAPVAHLSPGFQRFVSNWHLWDLNLCRSANEYQNEKQKRCWWIWKARTNLGCRSLGWLSC